MGAVAVAMGAALGVIGVGVAAAEAEVGATGGGATGSDNSTGDDTAGLPVAGCGAGATFGLASTGLTDAALTDAAFAATGCFSMTFATGVALAAAGGGRFAAAGAGLAAFAETVGCFTVAERAGLAEIAAGRRGADAAAREATAPLPFIALPADAFMPDTFNLCPSNVVNRRGWSTRPGVPPPDLRHPALTVRLLESAAAFTLRRARRHLLRPI